MNKNYVLERAVVEVLNRERAKAGINHSRLANAALGNCYQSPVVTWRAFRNPTTKTKQPASISIENAGRVAEALGKDLASVVWQAQRLIEDGWTPDHQD